MKYAHRYHRALIDILDVWLDSGFDPLSGREALSGKAHRQAQCVLLRRPDIAFGAMPISDGNGSLSFDLIRRQAEFRLALGHDGSCTIVTGEPRYRGTCFSAPVANAEFFEKLAIAIPDACREGYEDVPLAGEIKKVGATGLLYIAVGSGSLDLSNPGTAGYRALVGVPLDEPSRGFDSLCVDLPAGAANLREDEALMRQLLASGAATGRIYLGRRLGDTDYTALHLLTNCPCSVLDGLTLAGGRPVTEYSAAARVNSRMIFN